MTVFGAAPAVLLIVMLAPVCAGMAATLAPAFGYLPALGRAGFSLDPWRELAAWPGLAASLILTVRVALSATSLSLVTALGLAVLARRSNVLRAIQALIVPMLASPHSALAIGVAFLLAPSGWVARLVASGITGWTSPPVMSTVQDAGGWALVFGLWLKETPYLLLATLAALAQSDAVVSRRLAASLGYGPWRGWLLATLPRVWPQLRLPVMAVIAFSLSVVDVPLILGPTSPPTFGVQLVRWFSDPDLSRWFPACAGAVLLSAIVSAAVGALFVLEGVAARLGRGLARSGRRGSDGRWLDMVSGAAGGILAVCGVASIAALAVWSLAGAWQFPAPLPQTWSLATWRSHGPDMAGPALATVWIGGSATLIALLLTIFCLENERRVGAPGSRALVLLYLPLLVPQVAFLFGIQVLLVRLRMDGTAIAVIWAHLVFVLPYAFLSLADPWRALDPRLARVGACLGAPPARVLVSITLPALARPLIVAAAVGFAVSAGLYLPTLFAGAGRITTLTTEAVTLASGSDRRVIAATALLQTALPLLAFMAAVALPAARARRRLGMALGE